MWCDQLILLLYGIEFLWRKSGDLLEHYGYGAEYEVHCIYQYIPSIHGGFTFGLAFSAIIHISSSVL